MKKQLLLFISIIAPICANPVSYQSNHVMRATIGRTQEDKLSVEVSAGELFDKLTILQIKTEHITQPDKLRNIENELSAIQQTIESFISVSPELNRLVAQLKHTNQKLWNIEDAIRAKEAAQQFDQEFIDLARSVYIVNDQRGVLKRKINELLGSRLMEEKQYTNYEHK